jgi:acyl carrier protein
MDKQKFIELFKETIDIEDKEITSDVVFRDLEEWDSLALLSVIAMIDDEYDIIIQGNDFKSLNTLNDIMSYIDDQK